MMLLKTAFVALSWAATMIPTATGRILESSSLNSCQAESAFTASLFNVVVTPNNSSATINLVAVASMEGKVKFDIALNVYGFQFLRQTLDPCEGDMKLPGMCPMSPGKLDSTISLDLGAALDMVPGIAYTVPDLDAAVKVYVNLSDTGESIACVEAEFSNGQTVEQLAVKWVTAIIIGMGLISSAAMSVSGHSNAAAHLAANTLSLFGYFQAQAIIGLSGIDMPPIVQAWTQNYQWAMGIIHVEFMQSALTWYQRSTGGKAAGLFNALDKASVQVTKRSLNYFMQGATSLVKRGLDLTRRANIELDNGSFVVYGIQRVAFRTKIETTNLFATGLICFVFFLIFTVIIIVLARVILDVAAKQGWIEANRFVDFRRQWLNTLKGILFRLTLLGFPQMTILCLWEFTQVDSPALVVLAVFFFFGMLFTLAWAAFQIVRLAVHNNATYSLFSDPRTLNKWGFLYIQFRSTAYYFIIPLISYILIKGIFVAFGQHNGTLQAIALIIIELAALIATSVMRPWMDARTNGFNIAIYAFNFINAIFLLLISDVFGGSSMIPAISGILLFVINAAFSLILLLMIIISSILVFWRKDPDARYQFMADNRTKFMKSETNLDNSTELDALAVTARGDRSSFRNSVPRSPLDPAVPLFPSDGQKVSPEGMDRSPSPYQDSPVQYYDGRNINPDFNRQQHNASPWQRNAR